MTTIFSVGRGSACLKSSLLLFLRTSPFLPFVWNVDILNFFAITGRTTKCSHFCIGANGYYQPIHQFIKIFFTWNCRICYMTCHTQSAWQFVLFQLFLFSAKLIGYRLIIVLSPEIPISVALTAWIKTQNWMLTPTTLLAAFLCVRYNAQISLTFGSWVTRWIKCVPSVSKALVFCRHKNSTWHVPEPPCWREMVRWLHWGELLFHTTSSQAFILLTLLLRVRSLKG